MKKCFALIILFLQFGLQAQSKKEVIQELTERLDSVNEVIRIERSSNLESIRGLESQLKLAQERSAKDKVAADSIISHLQKKINLEREQSKTEIEELKKGASELEALISLEKKSSESLKNELEAKNMEITNLLENHKQVQDSLTGLIDNTTYVPKSIAYFKSINKENIAGINYDELAANMKLIKPVKYYVQPGYNGAAYFEKVLDNKVVMRGYAESECGDCSMIAINYYTYDGFLYLQEFSGGCVHDFPDYVSVKVTYFTEEIHECSTSIKMERPFAELHDFLNPNDANFYTKVLKSLKAVLPTFISTSTRPEVLDCIGFE
jgi:predicted  nucleic acid-binding Zn-ribbon protein